MFTPIDAPFNPTNGLTSLQVENRLILTEVTY